MEYWFQGPGENQTAGSLGSPPPEKCGCGGHWLSLSSAPQNFFALLPVGRWSQQRINMQRSHGQAICSCLGIRTRQEDKKESCNLLPTDRRWTGPGETDPPESPSCAHTRRLGALCGSDLCLAGGAISSPASLLGLFKNILNDSVLKLPHCCSF